MTQNRILLLITVIFIAFFINGFAFADSSKEKSFMETHDLEEQVSYAIGVDVYSKLNENFNVKVDLLVQGIQDALAKNIQMNDEQMKEALTNFQRLAQQRQAQNAQKIAAVNKTNGEIFLAENKKKEGVVTLASGLQYKIIQPGTGPRVKADDTIKCNYKGTLLDGTEFDSSYKRGQPAVFQVNQVIQGWVEALQLMKIGAKWQLFIPSDLAYGDRGAGQVIKPGSTLIFEVELLGVEETKEEVKKE